jgi:hypothetical protein
VKRALIKYVLIIAVACGVLNGAELIEESARVCSVAVQDRSGTPVSTSGLDDLITRAILQHGVDVVHVAFDPPADVEHAARVRGCSHILYTDIARTGETAGSRTCRAFNRLMTRRSNTTMNAEIEFRLFEVDAALPVVSTSVESKVKGRTLSPYVTSVLSNFSLH